jgi:hypothetical protein
MRLCLSYNSQCTQVRHARKEVRLCFNKLCEVECIKKRGGRERERKEERRRERKRETEKEREKDSQRKREREPKRERKRTKERETVYSGVTCKKRRET